MSKYRKSSLSPCWSALTANKENLNNQNVVSFKNMAANKKSQGKRHDFSPHNVDGYASIYTHAYRQLHFDESNTAIPEKISRWLADSSQPHHSKEKAFEEERANTTKVAKSDQEHRDIIKSKDKQISSLHSQVKVLENTIELLKTQVDALSKENKALGSGFRIETRTELQKLSRQNLTLKGELREYEQILQIIQNALIEQNREMKVREEKVRLSLKEIQVLLGSGTVGENSNRIYQMITSLINL